MSKSDNIINYNIMLFFKSKAKNYEFSKDYSDSSMKSIFAYYDTNNDNILQREELAKLTNDLQKANSDDYPEYFSKDELKNCLSSTINNPDISVKHLNNFLMDILDGYQSIIQNYSNGEIESFEQGDRGDCWLLSQIYSLSLTSWGKDAIKNSIINNNNSYTIRFSGVDFETTITQEDIKRARESENYSTGDLDVLLLELATEKYLTQENELGHIVRNEDVLEGSIASGKITMQYLLTGKTGHTFSRVRKSEQEHINCVKNQLSSISESLKFNLMNNQDNISNAYDRGTMINLIEKISKSNNIAVSCSFTTADKWENADLYTKRQIFI